MKIELDIMDFTPEDNGTTQYYSIAPVDIMTGRTSGSVTIEKGRDGLQVDQLVYLKERGICKILSVGDGLNRELFVSLLSSSNFDKASFQERFHSLSAQWAKDNAQFLRDWEEGRL